MFVSRAIYYLTSIPTLLVGLRIGPLIAAFLWLLMRRPFQIALRQPSLRFSVRGAMDVWVIKETCLDRDYEPDGFQIQDGWIILDIGAGIGDFSAYAASGRDRAVVYAFEPFPESFALLQENLTLNGVRNVHALQTAVGKDNDGAVLFVSAGAAVQHSTARMQDGSRATAIEVETITLDAAFDQLQLAHCDLLKIDCEGGEFDILFHAGDATLRKIRRVSLEYHDGVNQWTHQDLVRFFQANGFEVRTRPNRAHANLGLLYAARTAP